MELELRKSDNGSFETDKYYARGTKLVSVDIADGGNDDIKKLNTMDGVVL